MTLFSSVAVLWPWSEFLKHHKTMRIGQHDDALLGHLIDDHLADVAQNLVLADVECDAQLCRAYAVGSSE